MIGVVAVLLVKIPKWVIVPQAVVASGKKMMFEVLDIVPLDAESIN